MSTEPSTPPPVSMALVRSAAGISAKTARLRRTSGLASMAVLRSSRIVGRNVVNTSENATPSNSGRQCPTATLIASAAPPATAATILLSRPQAGRASSR